MPGHVIVDGNSLGLAFHRANKLNVGEFETQAIFGVAKACRELMVQYPDRHLIVLWDGRSQWRREIYPAYKGNRVAKTVKDAAIKEAYKKQVPFIQALLARLGVRQLLNYVMQADDLAGFMVMRNVERPVLLVTGDRDWCQLIGPGVTWYDPRENGIRVDESSFFQFTSYTNPVAFVQGKALMGDTSDNIGPVGGIGKAGAPEFLALYRDVYDFRARAQRGEFVKLPKAHAQLAGVWDRSAKKCADYVDTFPLFERNMKLMDLRNVPPPPADKLHSFKCGLDLQGVKVIMQRLMFVSLLRDFANWTRPFHEVLERKAA